MKLTTVATASPFNPEKYVAEELLEGRHSNVRIIKLPPGIALPPHTHGDSDLMLYVVEGTAQLDTDEGTVSFSAGDLAFFEGDEELRVSNPHGTGVVLLAFLSPAFPRREAKD